jgi:hypothetical protein
LTLVSTDFHEVPAKERMDKIVSAIGDKMAALGTVAVVAGTPEEFVPLKTMERDILTE